MSIPGNFLILVMLLVGGIITLNVISPNGNTIFEISHAVSEIFNVAKNAVAEIGHPLQFLQQL